MRNSLQFCGLVLLSIAFSCSTKSSKPKDILSKDEMANAMIEFYLKEARISSLQLSLQLQEDSALTLFQYYREAYGDEKSVPDSVFERSYQYYLSKPTEFSEIYDRIIDSLALREQRVGAGGKLL